MDFFQKKIGPVFLKEDSDAEMFVKKMTELAEQAEGQLKKEIETQIKLANYGLQGEKNIAYELKNSGIDMLILHDLYFECNDLQSQIDYLIITRKRIYILECKNLIGNIEIDNGGNFIRTYEINGKRIKEGLYSPITQNERHKNIIKEMRMKEKPLLGRFIFEKTFDNVYKSIVVLANPKTYVNAKFAKKEIKNQVIRADQLISFIKESEKEVTDRPLMLEEMQRLATFFLEKARPLRSDYAKKYEDMIVKINQEKQKITSNESVPPKMEQSPNQQMNKECPRCGAELVLRVAKKGENMGRKFLGCSSYPRCRFIENVE